MQYGKCRTYGKKNILKRLLFAKSGYVSVGLPLCNLDSSEEEQ